MSPVDPFDDISPPARDWAEFWAGHSRSFLLVMIADELKSTIFDWTRDLERRIGEAIVVGQDLSDGPEDEAAPLSSFDGRSVMFFTPEYLGQIETMLFPRLAPVQDNPWHLLGLAATGFHSALENFAKALGAFDGKGSLPAKLEAWINDHGGGLEAEHLQRIRELDATRHAIIHNRACADERYIRLMNSPLRPKERIPLTRQQVSDWAQSSWMVAAHIHRLA